MLEREVDQHLVRRVRSKGGYARKIEYTSVNGCPDRLVLLNGVHFVELKAPGKKPSAVQAREHARYAEHGIKVWVCDSKESVNAFIQEITCDDDEI